MKNQNVKSTERADKALAELRNALSRQEDIYDVGASQIRVTRAASGTSVAIWDKTSCGEVLRPNSAVLVPKGFSPEAMASALFQSEKERTKA